MHSASIILDLRPVDSSRTRHLSDSIIYISLVFIYISRLNLQLTLSFSVLGTFCTLDICISRLEDVGLIDIRTTVEKIRSQRAFSIQMPEQYIFCHLALIEYAFHKKLISTMPDLSPFDMSHSDDSD